MANQRGDKSLRPILLMGAGLILISAVLVWQIIAKNQAARPVQTLPTQAQSQLPFPEVTRISLADAKAAYDSGSAIFIDVRDRLSFDSSHIPNALNIELAILPAHLSELDSAKPIITYCT